MNWPVLALGEIADWGSGGTPKRSVREYFGDGVPWLSISDLTDGNVTSAKESLTDLGMRNCSAKLVPAGTLLIAMYGSIGKLGIAGMDLCTSQAIAFAKPNPQLADTRYLFHFLLSQRAKFMHAGRGGTQMNISQGDLKSWEIPLPPLAEQRRIAEILDQADALRTKRRRSMAHLRSLGESTFVEMFGDPAINPNKLKKVQLSALCVDPSDIRCGPFGTQLNKSEFRLKGVPLWGIRNVNANFQKPTDEFLDFSTAARLVQYQLVPGDIVMTRKGTVGNASVYPEGFPAGIMHSDLLRIRVDSELCSAEFLAHQLHFSRDVERQVELVSGGAIMAGINVSKLKSLEVLVPSREAQQEFQNRLRVVESLSASSRTHLADLDTLFASLQHRAFSGAL